MMKVGDTRNGCHRSIPGTEKDEIESSGSLSVTKSHWMIFREMLLEKKIT